MPPVKDWPIMHFTHTDNLLGIVSDGGLHPDCVVRAHRTVRECGDQSIKERRRGTAVKVPPGGVVGDYVPFYFAPRSPMLYKIHRGGVPTYDDGQDPLVYLVSSLNAVARTGVRWVASDGNTAVSVTEHTDDWATLDAMIDWPLMIAEYWNNTDDDGDRMRRRMAELLIHRFAPLECINGSIRVETRPGWYF